MTPVEYYQQLIDEGRIVDDQHQRTVIIALQKIYDQLLLLHPSRSTFLPKLTRKKSIFVEGLYLSGNVGVGKTFLVDCFFQCLPFPQKCRMHFHAFMQMIHGELTRLQGKAKPLATIAKTLATEYRVICLDELIVNDITDAMLLAGLFDALYQEKICLIFTSNTAPDALYLKGIQRKSFLPAIELIRTHANIIALSSHNDYRFNHVDDNTYYFTPLGSHSEQQLEQQFTHMTQKADISQQHLNVYDRDIQIRKAANGVVWFEFLALCSIPRSQQDYILIANNFHTILISNLTVIQPGQHDVAKCLINLIDVFYDTNRKIIISAEKPIEEIYTHGRLIHEFARTRSRLIEMQSIAWQKRCQQQCHYTSPLVG